jgi:hypothetical protein
LHVPLRFGVYFVTKKEMTMAKETRIPQQDPSEGAREVVERELERQENSSGGEEREERIRVRAYQLWETAGRPEGQQQEHWEQASRDIDAEDDLQSGNRVI